MLRSCAFSIRLILAKVLGQFIPNYEIPCFQAASESAPVLSHCLYLGFQEQAFKYLKDVCLGFSMRLERGKLNVLSHVMGSRV